VTRARGEQGYALVAAVASIVVFAAMALAILSTTRAAIATGSAEVGQARAAAAADAGVAIALSGLLATDPDRRWHLEAPAHVVEFAGARVSIRVEDERGKVPLNLLDEEMATRLLEKFGYDGDALKTARDSLLDWLDSDDNPRAYGAESAFYAPLGYRPRNGALASVGELRRVRGFDAGVVARMSPYLTVNFGRGNFEPRHADPIAIEIVQGDEGAAEAIDRARELAGQRVALDASNANREDLTAHPLMISVVAQYPDGARAERHQVIELTGSALRPYVVRSYD
jgi:general secretion pathway protein K